MRLRHLRMPGLVHYGEAGSIQEKLIAKHLAHKANPSQNAPVPPTVITAQFHPVYTCGRREVGTISPSQRSFLTQTTPWNDRAAFHEALRGGQTTFHGPGQLTAYPILDLRRHRLSPRDYVCLLEKSVIQTCAHFDVLATRTDHPGVWVDTRNKICAVGVHLRRHIASHGIGLNVSTDLRWFDRIVACGLEGKGTTSLAAQGREDVAVDEVADVFVKNLAQALEGVDGVDELRLDDITLAE